MHRSHGSTAIWVRLIKYLEDYGMYMGQTAEATSRGSMIQQRVELQASVGAQVAMCKQVEEFKRPEEDFKGKGKGQRYAAN